MTAGLVHSILRSPARPPLLSISCINAFRLADNKVVDSTQIKLTIGQRANVLNALRHLIGIHAGCLKACSRPVTQCSTPYGI